MAATETQPDAASINIASDRNHRVGGDDDDDGDMMDMWSASALDGGDCDYCGPPPPEFMLPPPPRPPFLQPGDPMDCTEDPLPIETCDALPLIDPSYRSSPSFQTSAVIGLCSVLLGLFIFIGVILVWKHKRKVQNFLPCKTSPQNTTRDGAQGAGVIYEDLHEVAPRPTALHPHHHHHNHFNHLHHHHTVAPSIELIDVKNNIHYPSGYPISTHPPVFMCSSPGPDPYCSQDLYNPVYEQLSDDDYDEDDDSELPPHSEDEFAEDELSLGGGHNRVTGGGGSRRSSSSNNNPHHRQRHHHNNHHHHHSTRYPTGAHHIRAVTQAHRGYRTEPGPGRKVPRHRRPHEPLPPLPNGSLPPARGGVQQQQRNIVRCQQEFHEGMLLDALLQMYPHVGGAGGGSVAPSPTAALRNINNNTTEAPSAAATVVTPQQHELRPIPSIAHRLQPSPYETVPVLGQHLATFRPNNNLGVAHAPTMSPNALLSAQQQMGPKLYDSAFGSDSGYSNHTSGTRGSSGRSGGTLSTSTSMMSGSGCGMGGSNRRGGGTDPRRLSQLSADLNMT